jgi:SAM-dependent methyltransferase
MCSPFSIAEAIRAGNEKPTKTGRFWAFSSCRRSRPSGRPDPPEVKSPTSIPAKRLPEKGLWPNARDCRSRRGYDSRVFKLAGVVSVGALFALAGLPRASPTQSLAPYIATPDDVVDRMLALAQVTREDVVYDLGCGDGRIPIAAAKKYGARGVGLDLDPKLIALAQANARAAGVDALVDFRVENVLTADVSTASVVTLYLLSSSNERLRPLLVRQLKPGARIVSHAFSMGRDWPADRIDQFVSARGDEVTLYLWKIQ